MEVSFRVKLLIVEDEPDMRKALEKGFLKRGFLVDTAEDGEEGAYLAQVNTYPLVLYQHFPFRTQKTGQSSD